MTARSAIFALVILAGCSPPPRRVEKAKPDPTRDPAYSHAVEQLEALNREAEDCLKRGRSAEAAAAITSGEQLQARLLAAPQPTLAAMEAVSDRDDLYGRMLLADHRDGWARMLFQKNLARWRIWSPQTPETTRRLRQAQARINECDRRLAQ